MLDGPQRVHRQVLERSARASEPAVVRHVHHHARAIVHELAKEVRKDTFVTDYDAERGWRTRKHDGTRAGLQISDEFRPAPHKSDHTRQRHEFSERNEVNLIISAGDSPAANEKRRVAELPGCAVED